MAENEQSDKLKTIEIDGYSFQVDTDLLDDVDTFDYIERIETKGQVTAIVPLLEFIMGAENYAKLKQHFIEADAAKHPDEVGYKGRFRISALNDVYIAILAKFDPKV